MRLVKTVIGKPVYRFPIGYRILERITGYQICRTLRRNITNNADANVLRCREKLAYRTDTNDGLQDPHICVLSAYACGCSW